MVRSSWIVAGIALWSSGCDRVFQLTELTGTTADASAGTVCLSDDFSGNALDTSKWQPKAPNGTSVAIVNEELVLTLAQASGDSYARIESATDDFADDIVEVELRGVPDQQTSAEAGLSIELTDTDRFMILVGGNSIIWRRSYPGIGDDDMGIPYNPLDHKYLRMRHEAGVMYWEWRNRLDGPWTVGRMQPEAPSALVGHRIIVFGGTFRLESTPPGTARFDNVVRTCR